jgi:hypothetical protein
LRGIKTSEDLLAEHCGRSIIRTLSTKDGGWFCLRFNSYVAVPIPGATWLEEMSMSTTATSSRQSLVYVFALLTLLPLLACGKKAARPAGTEQAQQEAAPAAPVSSPDEPPAPSNGLV